MAIDYTDNSVAGLQARIADVTRPTQNTPATGGIAINNDPYQPTPITASALSQMSGDEQGNAEKTARWALEDKASKVKYARSAEERKALLGSMSLDQQNYTNLFGPKTLSFESGGKPDAAEELLAKMAGKYKVGNSSQPAPAPATPAPQPQPQAKPAGGLIQQATGLMGGRAAQIEKAVNGYAQGGKPPSPPPAPTTNMGIRAASGFKVKGPGTATSDSIPAQSGSGQPIRIANGERIVSVEQDQALERIAEMLGFESVDAMFEAMTGKPVGPTVKGGQIAAATGMSPEERDYRLKSGNIAGPDLRGAGAALTSILPDESPIKRWANAAPVDKPVTAPSPQAAAAPTYYGNEGRSVPTEIKAPEDRVATLAAPSPQPVDNMRPADLTTKDILPGGYLDRGAGIVAQRGKTGQLNVTNVGTGELTDPTKQIVDGSASALIDQKNSTYNPAKQLANMQRLRLTSDAANPEITDPAVQAQAVQGVNILNAARQGDQQERAVGLQERLGGYQAEQMATEAELRKKALTGDKNAIAMLHALRGKNAGYKVATTSLPNPNGIGPNTQQAWGINEDTGEVFNVEDRSRGQQKPAAAIPSGAIDMLKKNPKLAAEFDAKFGAGASKQILGK